MNVSEEVVTLQFELNVKNFEETHQSDFYKVFEIL